MPHSPVQQQGDVVLHGLDTSGVPQPISVTSGGINTYSSGPGASEELGGLYVAQAVYPVNITSTADLQWVSGPCLLYGITVNGMTTAQNVTLYDNVGVGGTRICTILAASIAAGSQYSIIPGGNGAALCQLGVYADWASAPTAPDLTLWVRMLV